VSHGRVVPAVEDYRQGRGVPGSEDVSRKRANRHGTNVLLVYPETPVTFWSMTYAVEFIGKRSCEPPLGLIAVAAMLPGDRNRRVDANVAELTDEDVLWADLVLVSGMDLHRSSFEQIALPASSLAPPWWEADHSARCTTRR